MLALQGKFSFGIFIGVGLAVDVGTPVVPSTIICRSASPHRSSLMRIHTAVFSDDCCSAARRRRSRSSARFRRSCMSRASSSARSPPTFAPAPDTTLFRVDRRPPAQGCPLPSDAASLLSEPPACGGGVDECVDEDEVDEEVGAGGVSGTADGVGIASAGIGIFGLNACPTSWDCSGEDTGRVDGTAFVNCRSESVGMATFPGCIIASGF